MEAMIKRRAGSRGAHLDSTTMRPPHPDPLPLGEGEGETVGCAWAHRASPLAPAEGERVGVRGTLRRLVVLSRCAGSRER